MIMMVILRQLTILAQKRRELLGLSAIAMQTIKDCNMQEHSASFILLMSLENAASSNAPGLVNIK